MKKRNVLPKAASSGSKPIPSPPKQQFTWLDSSEYCLLMMLVLFRAANALLCRSLFVPDEHWQSLEVAYKMVFNRGYLSWEWQKAIRSYTHPLIFAILYKALVILRLDTPNIMAEAPRLLQSLLAAVGDLYVYRLSRHFFDFTTAKYALLSQLLSWFMFYCCTRTLSNTTEASLTPVILYYWIRALNEANETIPMIRFTLLYLAFSAISVIIRPTGAILWGPLFIYQLVVVKRVSMVIRLLGIGGFVGLLAVGWNLLVDRYFYEQWVLTQLNFMQFNVLEGHSAMFGVHPWHWYMSQGLPTVLYTSIPLLLHGVWLVFSSSPRQHSLLPFFLGVWLVFAHSFLKHKEFRFVYPVLPIAAVYVGASIRQMQMLQRKTMIVLSFLLLLSNIPMSAYFSLVHQRGGFAVMHYLRNNLEVDEKASILFLMPCHSTPLYSLFHTNTSSFLFLHCDHDWYEREFPYLEGHFYKNPASWIKENVVHAHSTPSYIVMYNTLYDEVKQTLSSYQEEARIFHTHFKDNEKIGSYIIVLKEVSRLKKSAK